MFVFSEFMQLNMSECDNTKLNLMVRLIFVASLFNVSLWRGTARAGGL